VIKQCLLLCVLVTLNATSTLAQTYVRSETGHTYVVLSPGNYFQSYDAAVAAGGLLVTVNDAAEQEWIEDTVEVSEFWIGLNDYTVERDFRWNDGTPFSYQNWNGGEPNNGHPWPEDEDCVVMMLWAGGKWNDWKCFNNPRYGLAEINTTPVPTFTPTITPTSTPTATPTATATPTPVIVVIVPLGESSDQAWRVIP
jgi:Lectin C-type domain